jgi:hypothetical protein
MILAALASRRVGWSRMGKAWSNCSMIRTRGLGVG